jgi:hypothetical protein
MKKQSLPALSEVKAAGIEEFSKTDKYEILSFAYQPFVLNIS